MYCICCKKDNIKPLSPFKDDPKISEEDHIWSVVKKREFTETTNNRMWDGGIVHIIDAGYGSNHDTDQYVIAICDECITREVEEGTLLYFGNYMSPGTQWVKEDLEKSKQIFRRRKNLDGLV